MKKLGIITKSKVVLSYQLSRCRPMIQQLKNGKKLTGVEIGVCKGLNAKNILDNLDIQLLYLVDPYDYFTEDKKTIYHDKEVKKWQHAANDLLCSYNNIIWVENTSQNAIHMFKDNTLDFVYIDGNHTYEFIKKDIELYYPKIKKGGIIGGHDFSKFHIRYGTSQCSGGVMYAVSEYAYLNELQLNYFICDWWIVKEDSVQGDDKK